MAIVPALEKAHIGNRVSCSWKLEQRFQYSVENAVGAHGLMLFSSLLKLLKGQHPKRIEVGVHGEVQFSIEVDRHVLAELMSIALLQLISNVGKCKNNKKHY